MTNKFKELGLSNGIVNVVTEMGFETPSEIQAQTIPLILKRKDVIGIASTGSGKTLAFASGIIHECIPGEGVQAIIMTPTRELAEQVAKVTRGFAKDSGLRIVEIFGGVGMGGQIAGIRRSEVVVGTPGRILDHLERRTLDLSGVKILVLDEADRMADMGFMRPVENIIKHTPSERQTLLFSATTSPDVKHLEKRYMREPIHVTVEKYVDPSKLKQIYYNVPSNMKFSLLVHSLKKEKSGIIMIFCNTRRNVDIISMNLRNFGLESTPIHGGLEQRKRSRIIESLHNSEVGILVCTDVAARGLDIKGVTHVYNYDIPKTSDEYIHRIGRTARAGERGMAINLVSNHDYENFEKVMRDHSVNIKEVDTPEVEKLHPSFASGERRPFRDHRSPGGHRGFRRDSRGPGRNYRGRR